MRVVVARDARLARRAGVAQTLACLRSGAIINLVTIARACACARPHAARLHSRRMPPAREDAASKQSNQIFASASPMRQITLLKSNRTPTVLSTRRSSRETANNYDFIWTESSRNGGSRLSSALVSRDRLRNGARDRFTPRARQ